MGFTQAGHLVAHSYIHQAERIHSGSVCRTIVHRIDSGERIEVGKIVIDSRGSEVFPDRLLGIVIGDGDAAAQFRAILDRPKLQQRLHAGNSASARGVVGNQRNVAQAQTLAKSFIVAKDERLIFSDRPAERSSEDVSLKLRDVFLIEEIPRVQIAVAKELIKSAVQLIRARRSHDRDLRAGAFAVFGTVVIFDQLELLNRVDAQQLSARSARCHVDL